MTDNSVKRARQSISATPEGLEQAQKALQQVCKGKKILLADSAYVGRTVVQNFFAGRPVGIESFQTICKQLELDWQQVAGLSSPKQNEDLEIAKLVQEVRSYIQPYIQQRCDTMRVLDMSQPIGLDDIYISVNILEKITRTGRWELDQLLRDVSSKDFDRFNLGNVREERVPGVKAVQRFSKLVILGKPGSGKTTFLKHLAMQCIYEQINLVPVFITLKDFAEASEQMDLLNYIARLIDLPSQKIEDIAWLVRILRAGKVFILLDGLDEIKDTDNSRVFQEIRTFVARFHSNRFIITCRIAAKEYIFDNFTEVEIADFDDEQITNFVSKWFRSKNDLVKANKFLNKLKKEQPIRELATSPILLTLLCLVFEDTGSFPSNRSELYKGGLDVLLKRWDVTRNIERDQAYKKLSLQRKEDLLSQIAYSNFEAGNYFFKQKQLERQITEYIQNLLDANTDPKKLELDSEAVLKSIEAQHGLFVERARGIYSFSHLTFHEYFTARHIVENCNPKSMEDEMLNMLVNHLTKKRWREVFLLTVGMLTTSDCLLLLMKKHIDQLLARDEQLQQFLQWVNEKSILLSSKEYKPAAIRACYFDFDIALDRDRTLACLLDFPFTRAFTCTSLVFRATGREVVDTFLDITLIDDLRDYRSLEPALAIAFKRAITINSLESIGVDPKLVELLKQLKQELPEANSSKEILESWWEEKGQAWGDLLRDILVPYRTLGETWHFDNFTDEQKKLLAQYYYANMLLIVCLNSDCYVSRNVRQEIENTLFLPCSNR
ncbi:MAG: NACHT domain-containing NTPase [Nostoc sp. CmiVER01]|uniref:NACHT domain-containing protein n=1 Tax=Nostoc sp. CmiVER01 TaxID=3075384 RepID=UPI002AD4BF70|nr:NACHT domain-containing NTPase [Nostoc sp. CmiVER01]MDZ8122822.1 NACHT domain-containing NTPase [Nostoc sp. CmiVER01]